MRLSLADEQHITRRPGRLEDVERQVRDGLAQRIDRVCRIGFRPEQPAFLRRPQREDDAAVGTRSLGKGPGRFQHGGDTQPASDDPLPACGPNTLNASSISITNNTGGVEFGGNTVTGAVSITNNTNASGPEVEANKITGSLACSGNVAAPTNDGLKNTVTGTKSGQCAGSTF